MGSFKVTKKSVKHWKTTGKHWSEGEHGYLKGIYKSINKPAAYGGVFSLRQPSGLPLSEMREFLQSSKQYTKFKAARQKFKRLKVRSLGVNHIWSVDGRL